MTLSEDQLQKIADSLFLLRKPAPVKLPKPVSTAGSLAVQLDPIVTPPAAGDPRPDISIFKNPPDAAQSFPDVHYADLSIGVVDFTSDVTKPKIWLHKPDLPWRIASTGKLAVLLAAAQLRDDVRKIAAMHLSPAPAPADYDQIFQMSSLWNKSKDADIRKIAGPSNAPRISTVFDLSKEPVDFLGATSSDNIYNTTQFGLPPRPALHFEYTEKQKTAALIYRCLKKDGSGNISEPLKSIQEVSFAERLWLTGADSDDDAATSCISEIGVPYLKAVQRAYGLSGKSGSIKGMYMLLAGGYSAQIPLNIPVTGIKGSPSYRRLSQTETTKVTDVLFGTDQQSTESGSVSALVAYMIALLNNNLVDASGSTAILENMSPAKPPAGSSATLAAQCLNPGTTGSLVVAGIQQAGANITKHRSKIGFLGPPDGTKKNEVIASDFVYLETADSTSGKKMKFGIVVQGMKVPSRSSFANLGGLIYTGLLKS